ncbi:hypothetical protein EDD22DRAFT_964473 [Suillus occidentalis]|nr:hypothetical protein EDD22DRAFT_964473 [Suillus occidentalis]
MNKEEKLELLSRILSKFFAAGHRIPIFFQMTKVMDIMEDFLKMVGWKYLRFDDGTKTEERALHVQQFNAKDSTQSSCALINNPPELRSPHLSLSGLPELEHEKAPPRIPPSSPSRRSCSSLPDDTDNLPSSPSSPGTFMRVTSSISTTKRSFNLILSPNERDDTIDTMIVTLHSSDTDSDAILLGPEPPHPLPEP